MGVSGSDSGTCMGMAGILGAHLYIILVVWLERLQVKFPLISIHVDIIKLKSFISF